MSDINAGLWKMADDAVEKLSEHCDSVRIFLTAPNGNGETSCYTVGNGNFHAQAGQIAEWMEMQREHARAKARRDAENSG